MSAKRAPMAPPDLPGFTYVDLLGSGGFADVYLYEQQLPKRRVAVKVLLTDRMSSGSVEEFTAEANVMAMLSTHPAIVTIYQAGVAQDGRPYLVMEYCPRPNLQVRYRREPFSIAESLRVGVQVAAAVETAHRAGVLHRDIKPANILVTEYNRPALTDFGIASTTSAAAESAGLSIPWSPPESFADVPRSDPRSDVYALGATVYTLLAGRSPFELPGQRNTAAELIHRIETLALPALGRADVPVSLQRVLDRAMAKAPADRYESALAFARALQTVQIELAHSVTPIDILDDHLPDDIEEDEDDGLTRVRGVVSINPDTTPAAGMTRPSATTAPSAFAPPASAFAPPAEPAAADTVARPAMAPSAYEQTVRRADAASMPLDETVLRAPVPVAPPFTAGPDASSFALPAAPVAVPDGAGPAPRRRTGLWIGLGVGALVLVAVIVGVSLPGILAGTPDAEPQPSGSSAPQDPLSLVVPAVEDVTGAPVEGGVRFTWTNPDPQDGDTYIVTPVTITDVTAESEPVDVAEIVVPAAATGQTCVDVTLVRENGRFQQTPTRGCTP
ncbi:serine/threonine-protein kinase [Microbacterium sp. M3]|uniref:non-specific serine/threonine protein kinase n=1 Tax=Microbacterium arthrosphaerae TaxID=792652 RepID=A0ABU4H2T2_9MICO|nr:MULTISPECIES: serine/threonine-protein kinase [Microbacterium]MDW4573585.1 serine/threonine-protein kinase [Microbacterium arthrosphaerae]MDW7607440.1 serine/threonine-protein kinase [Microbacterium sp. M3]